jgi:hypothetical protein
MRETPGSAAALAARCKNLRRGSFILNLPDKKRGPDFRAFLRRLDTFGREVRHSMLPLWSVEPHGQS